MLFSLLTLLTVCLIALGVLSWVIFTPEKLTPIVRNQLDKLLICEHETGEVELTFFSTFPQFGVKINDFLLKNPLPGTPSDTLFHADKILASIDFKALWNNRELIVNALSVDKPFILAFTDSTGLNNYDIMRPDDQPDDTTAFELPFRQLVLEKISLKDAHIVYHDAPMDMVLSLSGLNARLSMCWRGDLINGKIKGDAHAFTFYWDEIDYLQDVVLDLNAPFSFDLKSQTLQINKSALALNKLDFDVDAMIQYKSQTNEIVLDIAFNSVELPVNPLFDLLQVPYEKYLEGITIDGKTFVNGSLKGVMGNSMQPVFALHADFKEIGFAYESLPYQLFDVSGKADIEMDMNDSDRWFVKVFDFEGKTGKSSFSGAAFIDQLMGDMRFDIDAKARLNLVDAKPMLPDDMPLEVKGLAIGNAKIKFLYSQFMHNQFDKMLFDGKFKLKDLTAAYDTIAIQTQSAELAFKMPNIKNKATSFIELDINTNTVDIEMGKEIKAGMQGLTLLLSTSNMMLDDNPLAVQGIFTGERLVANMDNLSALLHQPSGNFSLLMDLQDSTAVPLFDCEFEIHQLVAEMDTIHVDVFKPDGLFIYQPDPADVKRPFIQLEYQSEKLAARMGSNKFSSENIRVDAGVAYDGSQENFLLQWIPKGYVKMEKGCINVAQLGTEILIPAIDFDFTPDKYLIRDSRLLIDKSDFQLTGKLSNVGAYLRNEGLLMGDFNFRSNTTDVNKLMAMFNGLGYEKTELLTDEPVTPAENSNYAPFMVPKGVDIALYTSINEALFANDTARSVQGTVTVKDGLMVLESMLFTTSAAKMQLTGMYRTPRKNHLYMGLDFHLLEIEIAELLDLIPDVDSIMPMLRSFSGKGEFHIAIETYLDSAYNIKKPTLRGASSIRGHDLVLLDGETFTEIAKTLRFNKKTENKIDSLSAEFTVFRNEVDVYPFLIVMDRYKAIVEGRHNLDMNFDYHISLIDSPLPFQLGVDVKGNLEDMKIRPAKCKYANMYRPAFRNEVDTKKLELRRMIRQALTDRVREE